MANNPTGVWIQPNHNSINLRFLFDLSYSVSSIASLSLSRLYDEVFFTSIVSHLYPFLKSKRLWCKEWPNVGNRLCLCRQQHFSKEGHRYGQERVRKKQAEGEDAREKVCIWTRARAHRQLQPTLFFRTRRLLHRPAENLAVQLAVSWGEEVKKQKSWPHLSAFNNWHRHLQVFQSFGNFFFVRPLG